MFTPRLTDLFETFGVVGPAAHSIHILRDGGVIVARQRKPIQIHDAGIARRRPYSEPDKAPAASTLLHGGEITDDDIGSRDWFQQRAALEASLPIAPCH